MANGDALERYMRTLQGGTPGGPYQGGPIYSFHRPLTPQKRLQLQELYSDPTRGKATIDPWGRVLGYEKEGTLTEQRAQERLIAKLTGGTSQQLLGTRAGRPDLTFLTPEQLARVNAFRESVGLGRVGGATSENGPAMSSALAAPGVSNGSAPDSSSFGLPRTMSPKLALGILAGVLVLAFVARRG